METLEIPWIVNSALSGGFSRGELRASAKQRVYPLQAEILLIAALLGLVVLAWLFTDLEMAGMDAGPGTDPGAFGFYITTWVVMTAAMMFPSLTPMVVVLRRRARNRPASSLAMPLFLVGYLAVWTTSGLVAYGALKAGRSWAGDVLAWHRGGQALAGAALFVAAAYEFAPVKTKFLRKCRSPFGFPTNAWRDGPSGSLSMGIRHGAACLGCCWALMVALFALGAMSLTWMAVLAALIAAEKLLPWRRIAIAAVTAVLLALAVGVTAVPADVPGLTVPGGMSSAPAMRTMSASLGGIDAMGERFRRWRTLAALYSGGREAETATTPAL